jgi:hypothetical protein
MRNRGLSDRPRALALLAVALAAAVALTACTAAQASPTGSASKPRPTKITGQASASATFIGDCCAPPTRRPYALVTARPSRDQPPAPSGSVRPTASPTAADSLSEDGAGRFDKTIPAYGSITEPIDFEGSSWGTVVLWAQSDGLTVTFGGKALEPQKAAMLGEAARAFSAESDNAINGDLVATNTTSAPIEVVGFAWILTRRHLNIHPSELYPRVGQTISFDVTLTEATSADDVTVTVADMHGNSTPASVTKVATGHWIGRATFSAAGDGAIYASTTSARSRVASYPLTVAVGNVSLSSTFHEEGVDSDRDGLVDQLVLTPTITVATGGEYMANAKLLDESGVEVASNGQGEMSLVAGTQPLRLEFDGSLIYKSGRWGPYTLDVTIVHITSTATTIELADAQLGETAAYDYRQFQHDRVSFDPDSFATLAVDTNGDGLYEELDFTGTVTVETAGLYEINTSIYADNPWEHVAMASTTAQLVEGQNKFKLVFKGSDIARSGRDGPYIEEGLLAYLDSDPMDAQPTEGGRCATQPYTAGQFAP